MFILHKMSVLIADFGFHGECYHIGVYLKAKGDFEFYSI